VTFTSHHWRTPLVLIYCPGDRAARYVKSVCGEILETILRLRPLSTMPDQRRPKALTCTFGKVHRSSAFQSLIRDEEAAGSTPTTKRRVTGGRRAHEAGLGIGAMAVRGSGRRLPGWL